MTISSENSRRLELLSNISGTSAEAIVNQLLDQILGQVVNDGDTGLLEFVLRPLRYDSKEEVLAVISRYDAFASAQAHTSSVAKPMREVSTGLWMIAFRENCDGALFE
jgi:hypothetical protein